jgi:hypothetical protein
MMPRLLRLIKQNPAAIVFTFSLTLLVSYALLLKEGGMRDADAVGIYAQYSLIIGCLMHFSLSLLRARKEVVKHRLIVRIPVFRVKDVVKTLSLVKYRQLCVCLPLISFASSFIFLFLLNDRETATLLFNATYLLILIAIFLQLLRPITSPRKPRLVIRVPAYVFKEYFAKERIKAYVSENPGAPFILSFQSLLIACAMLLVEGNEAMANELAVYAYYALVLGVLLQIASYFKEGRKSS